MSGKGQTVLAGEPLKEQQASQMTGYLGTAMVIASCAAGVNLIRQKQCVEGVSAMTIGLLGTLLMFGGLTAPNPGEATTNAYSLAAQFIAILFIALALVRILTIVRNCPGYSVDSVAKGMKCQSPSPKMEQGIGEFITGVVFLCALYIFAQNKSVAGEVSDHINALGKGLKGLARGFGGTKDEFESEGSGDESRDEQGDGGQEGGKRMKQGCGVPVSGMAGGRTSGSLAKLQDNWLLGAAVVLLLMVMAIGFGTNSRVGWITSTVLAVLILIVLSVVYVLSKVTDAENTEGRLGAAVEWFKQAGAYLGTYAAGLFALVLTLSGMSLAVSGAGAFNQGCSQQTAG